LCIHTGNSARTARYLPPRTSVLDLKIPDVTMAKQNWDAFASTYSQSFVHGLVPSALSVQADKLVDMAFHREQERTTACGGEDPIRILVAYAQNSLVYDEDDNLVDVADPKAYKDMPRERRLNKFGLAYRPD